MRTLNRKILSLFFVLFVVAVCSCDAVAQKRPKSIDPGDVKETRPDPKRINRPTRSSTRATRAANGVMIIMTEPERAEIEIDGQPAGASENGEFRKELQAGKRYSIKVSAGPRYQIYEKQITLKAGQPEVLEALLTYKYGSVKLGPVIEGAKLFIDDKPVPPDKYKLDESSRMIVISDIPEGKHKIAYDHADYLIQEKEFNISPGSNYDWTFVLKRATVEMSLKTDPRTAVYLDGEPKGETTGDGTLKLSDVSIGTHEIKLIKDGFEEQKVTRQFEYGAPVEIALRLTPLATSAGFDDDFPSLNTSRWTIPQSGWKVDAGRLHIANSPSLGSPTDIRYFDFEMNFHLRLTNGGGAAWALRVKDSGHYYLFYLSGPGGLFPNRFNAYAVVDNKFDPNAYSDSQYVPAELKAGGEYTIDIKVTKNTIDQWITSASTGEKIKLGHFVDSKQLFPYGNIGFRTVGTEQFSVDDLFVTPKGQ